MWICFWRFLLTGFENFGDCCDALSGFDLNCVSDWGGDRHAESQGWGERGD